MGTPAFISFVNNGKLYFHQYQHYDGYPEEVLSRLKMAINISPKVWIDIFSHMDFMTPKEYKTFLEDSEMTPQAAAKAWPWNADDSMGIDVLRLLYDYWGRHKGDYFPFVYSDDPGFWRPRKSDISKFRIEYYYVVDFGKKEVYMYVDNKLLNGVGVMGNLTKLKPWPAYVKRFRIDAIPIIALKFNDFLKVNIQSVDKAITSIINGDIKPSNFFEGHSRVSMKDIVLG